MAEESDILDAVRPTAIEGRCGAGPCGHPYDTGGACSGHCEKLVDGAGNHTMGGGHTCEFGHPF